MIKADLSQSKYLLIAGVCMLVFTFWPPKKETKEKEQIRSYQEIVESGILHVATEYNSISFVVNGDTVTGFHYELINLFASSIDVKVEVTPVANFDERIKGLTRGTFDIVAYNMPINAQFKDSLLFTIPILLDKQVLIQRQLSAENDTLFIDSQLKLGGRKLYIEKGSPAALRIKNISEEIGDTIFYEEIEKYGQEQLIAMVAHGDIDYAVCDEELALTMIDSLPQIDINTAISFTQFYGWATNRSDSTLVNKLNGWLEQYMKTNEFKKLKQRYNLN